MLHISLKPDILVQEQFNGDLAVLDPESLPETYWIANGLAADVIRILQNETTKPDLLKALAVSYRCPKAELEKNVNKVLATLAKQNILKKRRRLITKKARTPKTKLRAKKDLAWNFSPSAISASEILTAFACQMDSDCPPGQICYLFADSCLNYCSTS